MTSSSERRLLRRWRALAVALVTALAAGSRGAPAWAQASSGSTPADPKEMARRLGEEALGLHQRGRFAEAYEKFETAERIAHSPVFVLWMARGKRATGSLLLARKLYDKIAAEALPADASPNWVKARADAATERDALAARIPHLEVRLARGAAKDARIEIDGRPVGEGERIELDPGEHVVRAVASGVAPVERRVRLEEGPSPPPLEIALGAGGIAPAPARTEGSIVPGAVTLGIGAAALAGGSVGGIYALVLAGQVKDGCVGDQCRRSDEGKAGDAGTLARVATGLLIGGAVVTAAGIVLLVVRPGGGTSSAGANERAALTLGPASTRFTVRF